MGQISESRSGNVSSSEPKSLLATRTNDMMVSVQNNSLLYLSLKQILDLSRHCLLGHAYLLEQISSEPTVSTHDVNGKEKTSITSLLAEFKLLLPVSMVGVGHA